MLDYVVVSVFVTKAVLVAMLGAALVDLLIIVDAGDIMMIMVAVAVVGKFTATLVVILVLLALPACGESCGDD